VSENPTVLDLLAAALRAGGYDGLCKPVPDEWTGTCWCDLNDLCTRRKDSILSRFTFATHHLYHTRISWR
jgi:hypothetical protein